MNDLLKIHRIIEGAIVGLDSDIVLNGWCLPDGINLNSYIEFKANSTKSNVELLELFYGREFNTIVLAELNRPSLILISPYDLMLKEVITAYELGYFNICIPSLFSIIEAMLVFLANDGDFTKIRYINGLNNTLELPGNSNIELKSKLHNIKEIVENYFQKIEFNSEVSSSKLNRHESAHGRKVGSYNKTDCLKLLVLISVIKSCYNN